MAASSRLSRERWVAAALQQMAGAGTADLSVEALARVLGATKGSFYWHFRDRHDLVTAAVEWWENEATAQVVAGLAQVDDPRERLAALLTDAFGDPRRSLDTALATMGDDPHVGPAVQRVTRARLAFLADAYRQCGLAPREADRWARVAYATYLGQAALARALPADAAAARAPRAFISTLCAMLVPPPTP